MKTCPACKQTYNDDEQNFCLNDGTTLVKVNDDPPPTVFMDPARKTNQNWSNIDTSLPPQWQNTQNQQMTNNQPFGAQGQTNQSFGGQNQSFGGQSQQSYGGQNQPQFGGQNQQFGIQGQAFAVQGQNQTLAIVSLGLGVTGIVLSVCCYGGIPFGLAALITGYIATNNIKGDPMAYGGKNFAVVGMITGAVGFLITAGIFLMVVAANLFK